MKDQEIVLANTKALADSGDQAVACVMQELANQWVNAEYIAKNMKSLIDESFILTNSGEKYRDNKVVLETIKTVLKMAWAKTGDGPQVVIFNNNWEAKRDGRIMF